MELMSTIRLARVSGFESVRLKYATGCTLKSVIADLLSFVASLSLAYLVGRAVSNAASVEMWVGVPMMVLIWTFVFHGSGLCRRSLTITDRDEFYLSTVSIIISFILVTPFVVFVPILRPHFLFLVVGTLFAIPLVGWQRVYLHRRGLGRPERMCITPDQLKAGPSRLYKRFWICVKRLVDFAVSLLLLCALSPILLICGLAVFLDSGRPVLFRQERVGLGGRIFKILKFRTMVLDADQAWAIPGDRRVTRVGRMLRRFSLDELPQLYNVVRGDMSLVGPRPEMVQYERHFAETIPTYQSRRSVLPGITGLAQISMPRSLSQEDIVLAAAYDLLYVVHWSLTWDLAIVLKTACEFPFQRAV
jgi:lipopolysaccharide/colanic/teichoic acid biosynthesis glycosyltransferase